MSAVLTLPDMAEERTMRLTVPLPSPRLCTQRLQLLQMTLSLSTLTDEQKYNDVVACVKNWANIDIMSYIEIIHDTYGHVQCQARMKKHLLQMQENAHARRGLPLPTVPV